MTTASDAEATALPVPADGSTRPRPNGSTEPLLTVTDLKKHFPIRKGFFGRIAAQVHAVDGVSFTIGRSETLGVVGESGCGKTTVGRCLIRLIEPTSGQIEFDGDNIRTLAPEALRKRRRDMQIVFQDPFASLNPRMTVEDIVAEPLVVHAELRTNKKQRREKVAALLEECGLDASYARRYPHEFSGGQRQRIGIARALAPNPRFIVLDEAVSALDVSVRAQILNLLAKLAETRELAYCFISHDLHVVEHVSDRVAVMYLGEIVESAPAQELYEQPLHPYTRALLSANPVPDPTAVKNRIILEGAPPTPIDPPSGCRFHPRCPAAKADPKLMEKCKAIVPPERATNDARIHTVHCLLYGGEDGQPGLVEKK